MSMVKILVDENLSFKIVSSLEGFPGSAHVREKNLDCSLDSKVWSYAKNHGFCILTRDINFYNMSVLYGCHPKIIHLLTPPYNQSSGYFRDKIMHNIGVITDFLANPEVCYLMID